MSKFSRKLKHKYSSKVYRRNKKIKEFEQIIINIVAVVVTIIFIIFIKNILFNTYRDISVNIEDVKAFRIHYKDIYDLKEFSDKNALSFPEVLAVYSIDKDFFPSKNMVTTINSIDQNFIVNYEKVKKKYKEKAILPYKTMFSNFLNDIKYFPIPNGYDLEDDISYMYGDSWGAGKSYGKSNFNRGTDILDRENVAGRIPIVSMTDGVITDMGWSAEGGFQIGITASSGNYYYYAHFDSFAEGLAENVSISAGQFLGYMGNSGYDKKEGTKGKFVVSLHIEMMSSVKIGKDDMWVNPYPYLRYIESKKVE